MQAKSVLQGLLAVVTLKLQALASLTAAPRRWGVRNRESGPFAFAQEDKCRRVGIFR